MPSRKKKKELTIYTLLDFKEGTTFCVCTSLEKLKEAVGYWMNERPLTTMTYLEWQPNYVHEPMYWGWAYISPTVTVEALEEGSGGGWVPQKELHGINLLEVDQQPYYDAWHDEMIKDIYAHETDQV